jgi:hypothetical protein
LTLLLCCAYVYVVIHLCDSLWSIWDTITCLSERECCTITITSLTCLFNMCCCNTPFDQCGTILSLKQRKHSHVFPIRKPAGVRIFLDTQVKYFWFSTWKKKQLHQYYNYEYSLALLLCCAYVYVVIHLCDSLWSIGDTITCLSERECCGSITGRVEVQYYDVYPSTIKMLFIHVQ